MIKVGAEVADPFKLETVAGVGGLETGFEFGLAPL